MARKQLTIVIDAEGRDKDKAFQITEMSSAATEDWAVRAFMGMARAGVEIPDDVEQAGFAGIVMLGFKSLASMSYVDAKPLLNEMMDCVKIIPDPANPKIVRDLIDSDIEEVKTRFTLRKEVFDLHANFSELVARLTSDSTKEE